MTEVFDAGESNQFFAPVTSDVFDSLLGQYNATRARIIELAEFATGNQYRSAMSCFIEGNAGDERFHRSLYVDKLFGVDGAIAALNATYWSKALALTDVREMMPQARRNEWDKSIRERTTPDFTEDAVRPTLIGLLNSRQQFLAEKVDGIFRGLSGEHVTNAPEGFGKRMIIARIRDCYGYVTESRAGLIHDLRCVIARFMGRDEPRRSVTSELLDECNYQTGKWVSADGGALRVRTYKNGNGHMEVHPDMAWRLNMILAHLYPAAIPTEFRQKPARRPKEFPAIVRPLPFAVLEILSRCLYRRRHAKGNEVSFEAEDLKSPHFAETRQALESVGGTMRDGNRYFMDFDYPPGLVLREIVATGCLPDRVSFQFHQTSEALASDAVDWADIADTDSVLEPSAGQGAIAALLPANRLQCVELSALHCAVLKARGLKVDQADFIQWATDAAAADRTFNVVVMNPPFADGRAQLHVEHAFRLLAPGGRLVAVLPASMRSKQFLPGVSVEWSRVYSQEFKTTDVSVTLMYVKRPAASAAVTDMQIESAELVSVL
ncbi:DUF4942 domain-containing protein [Paraburkholderia phytofirmans]|uniref:DNA restriction methylase n=1 Tax=Paraburkholderia phytofirmans (strain DSM 17436 / LMG 22146 / PsJN) TaxID=398527 RepID=B2TH34_PARPJ|nr:DUF4942 domain-containing protein [Paraburkholderia phytofirmans]ACD21583.1 DNA restriction methylase [Paraburkholderia phytofirmans PsJN]